MPQTTRLMSLRIVCLACTIWLCISGGLSAADKAKIAASISRAQRFLLQQKLSGPTGSIGALAFVKSGGDKKNTAIQSLVQEVCDKIKEGIYVPKQDHNYEAGVDMMLLEAIDPQLYRPQMETITAYLVRNQQPNGAWFYPHVLGPDNGDTSITQYAVMGLWAAARAEIEIPVDVWEKAAIWHVSRQRDDAGFAYHPLENKATAENEMERSSVTMTAAGTSSLLIIRRVLFGDAELASEVRPPDSKRRFGVLERFVEEKKTVAKKDITIRVSSIDSSLKGSVQWMIGRYGEKGGKHELLFSYHLYTIERVAALMDVSRFGNHDWYDEGSDELLFRQLPDGSWNDECRSIPATAMGLMFLSKATTTIIAPRKRQTLLGGGLQAGGRGLPDNLDSVQMKDGDVSTRKIVGPIDELLIELERSSDAKVEDVQAAVVEAVQLDHPEELIGQMARLKKLASDPRIEVRRTALWALGRSGDISAAPLLIQGLTDPDLSVVREASLGLCNLSRRPEGCGKAIDPTDDLQMGIKDEATDEQRKVILTAWQMEVKKRWLDSYQKNRSYEERDDRTSLKRTAR